MTYLASELISRAYYIAGIVARGDQTVSGQEATDGLFLLNALLASKSIKDSLIPYYKTDAFDTEANKEHYEIEGLISLVALTFDQGTVRFPTNFQTTRSYYASGRVITLNNLPFNFNARRTKGGMTISFYPLPQTAYPVQIFGKFSWPKIESLDEDLEDVFDDPYIEYLRLKLSRYICIENNITMQPDAATELKSLENSLINLSAPDLTINKYSTLKASPVISWPFINLGNGYWPGGVG